MAQGKVDVPDGGGDAAEWEAGLLCAEVESAGEGIDGGDVSDGGAAAHGWWNIRSSMSFDVR